jgi:alkaline phosphatase
MWGASALAMGMIATFPGMAFAQEGKTADDLSSHGAAQRIAQTGVSSKAKNVILFIGDGMGDSEITVARDYLKGASGSFDGLDAIGQPDALSADGETGTGQYTTYSLGSNSSNRGVVTPVTDSAASGSGWATGTKTYNNAVSVDVSQNPQMNVIELAKANGLATGNVTTAEIQDATPAVLESHSTQRSCYGPQGKTDGTTNNAAKNCDAAQLKENGGIGSISEQLLDTRADVTIGGGSKYFKQTAQAGEYAGKTLWEQAAARGLQTASNDVDAFSKLSYKKGKPVLALLSDGNMPTQYNTTPALSQKATEARGAVTCSTNSAWLGNKNSSGNSASLADMATKAVDLLSAQVSDKSSNTSGFFLQVEGASIDKQDHAANACGQIGETDDLDKAISATVASLKASGQLNDTLIIVTADHAHTSQIVSDAPAYALSTILKSPVDGSTIVVSYGTATSTDAGADDFSVGYTAGGMEHTGTQLRIAASGPGARRVTGLTDQTDNFYTIAKALGLAADTSEQKALSDSSKVSVTIDDSDKATASVTGFDGDAVLSYSLKDGAGKVVASSETTSRAASIDGVSGVRVRTGQTTPIDLGSVDTGASYTLTVSGKQSGRTVSAAFDASSQDGQVQPGADKSGEDQSGNREVAVASVADQKNAAGLLGSTGSAVMALVTGVAMLAIVAGVVFAARRGMFRR